MNHKKSSSTDKTLKKYMGNLVYFYTINRFSVGLHNAYGTSENLAMFIFAI